VIHEVRHRLNDYVVFLLVGLSTGAFVAAWFSGGLRVGACFVAATSGDYFSRLANDAATCAHQAVASRQNPARLAMAKKMAINRYNWYSIYQ
jgi:hypothetical protein